MRTYATPEQIARWVEAVRMRDEGYKLKAIAERLGINEPNASRMVARGRKYLAVEGMKRKPVRRKAGA